MEFVVEKTIIILGLFIDSANDGCQTLQKD
jgi:hypothetical protein